MCPKNVEKSPNDLKEGDPHRSREKRELTMSKISSGAESGEKKLI
jgi:hypothetical protein